MYRDAMPGLKQLEFFRNELSNLGNEREVTAGWGEVYEELPVPVAPTALPSQTSVDDLLASLGGDSTPSDADFSGSDGSPSALDNLPGLDDLLGSTLSDENSEPSSDHSSFDSLLDSLPLDEPPVNEPRKPKPMESVDLDSFSDLLSAPEPAAPAAKPAPAKPAPVAKPAAAATQVKPAPAKPAPKPIEPVAPAERELPGGFDMPTDFTMPGDFDIPSGFDAPSETAAEEPAETLPEVDNFSLPDDLLAGFSNDIEDARKIDAETHTDTSFDTVPDFSTDNPDIPDISDFGEAEELSSEPGEPTESSVDAITGLDSLLAAGLPELDEMDFTPSFEMEGESPAAAGVPSAGEQLTAEEKKKADDTERFGADFADFSIPADLDVPGADSAGAASDLEAAEGGSGLDGFDGFSLDEDFLKTNIDAVSADSEDFHIPGFSDFTSGKAQSTVSPGFSLASGDQRRSAKKDVPLEISEEDFTRFMEELASFPLNLRIAIEEFLSGEAGSELQKMELVHSILGNAPVRKIAKTLEKALDRSIPIPKDFEKKTVAEYEREKSSLKYILVNKILPIATIFSIVAILTACVVFLSYQFIYRPLAAENLYRRGYTAIEDTRYTQAISLFDKAIAIWNKKSWYFKYAEAFRDKKQYISAELMYETILDRFNNDKTAGLEYAEMLRTDLRNFEKAENILRRRLLDNYVNDRDALMLLGDNYLDWADEDPSKFEEARKTYATLIQLYGNQDPYLARMMRYFIRMNNLKEVLSLKAHFMDKKAKIGASDLVELSGYLLDKRYEPLPGDNDNLRNQIEDLHSLLERAVKADVTSPEASYNMGRYLIYNYKNPQAILAFDEALKQFDNARTMTPRRVLSHIDTFRLLGEVYADQSQFLQAQEAYGQGITLYEDQRVNRTVHPDPRVGKLYADYADIDYFISADPDGALRNYRKAIDELNDTPSIRYRIGYLDYQKQDYESSLNEFLKSYEAYPKDKNVLYGLGNALFRRGDYFASHGYYESLMEMLETERLNKGIVFPQIRVEQGSFVEEYMKVSNNLGVILNRLATRTGDSRKNSRALELLSDSSRAWDALTRNPLTLERAQGFNLSYLNTQNMTRPHAEFTPDIYQDIPRTLEKEKILKQNAE